MPKKGGKDGGKVKPYRAKKEEDDLTEIVCVVDRSGSMASIKNDAIGGFNNFLEDQKKLPGEARMTVALFDHEYLLYCSDTPLKNVLPLTSQTYIPRGSTSLNDAVGKSISNLNQRNPTKAIIVILTDGHENNSTEYTKQAIKAMVAECEKKGWAVIYLSADANAFDDGASIGIARNNMAGFTHDTRGSMTGMMAASMASGDYRSGGRNSMSTMAQYSTSAGNRYDSMGSITSTHKKKKFF